MIKSTIFQPVYRQTGYFLLFFTLLFFSAELIELHGIDLAFRRSLILDGEYWRLITAGIVHTNYTHLMMNLSGLLLFVFSFPKRLAWHTLTLLSLLLASCINLAILLFIQQAKYYYGFSGALYGLFWWFSLVMCFHVRQKLYLLYCLFLITKVIHDIWLPADSLSSQLIQAPVFWPAHIIGMLLGTFFAYAEIQIKKYLH